MINKKAFALTLVAASVIASGCSSDDNGDGPDPAISDVVIGELSRDVNGDGMIDADDDLNGDDAVDQADFDLVDTDGDGIITEEELAAYGAANPGAMTPGEEEPEVAVTYPAFDAEGNSVADIIANEPRLSTLATVVPQALLDQLDYTQEKADAFDTDSGGDISGDEVEGAEGVGGSDEVNSDTDAEEAPEVLDYTIFAPSDTALAAADTAGLSGEELSNLLLGHVVQGEIIPSVEVGDTFTAANGSTITITGNETGGPVINDGINFEGDVTNDDGSVSAGTQTGDNGVVHIIDMVILPSEDTMAPAAPMPPTDGDGDNAGNGNAGPTESGLANSPDHTDFTTQFRNGLGGPSLDDPANTWTVFAPTNASLAGGELDLQNYVVTTGSLDAEALGEAGSVTTNNGVSHTVTGSADDGDLAVDGNPVSVLVEGDSSIVYSVDGILN